MAHVFVPNGIRTVLRGHGAEGQELLNTFHAISPSAPPSAADCAAVNDVFFNWWQAVYKNMVCTTCEATDVVSTGMNGVPASQHQRIIGTLGTRVGFQVEPETTLSVKAATALSGKRNRGRNYAWPFVLQDLMSPGNDRVTDPYRSAINATFNALVSRMNTAGYTLGVFSQADAAIHPISSYAAVDDYIDVQRRRIIGRGR
jgi:hypothetical protein